MASLDSILTKQALKKGIARRVTNDLAVGLRLKYVGTGTVTTVAATIATSIVLTTSDGGTDTYLFSSYSTVGALADAINGDSIFECKVMDVLRSENPDDMFFTDADIAAGTDAWGTQVWDFLIDTSSAATMACVLSPHLDFNAPKGHRVHLREIGYIIDNTAAFDTLTITERKADDTETVLYAATNTDNSAATLNWASGLAVITADWDAELVVQFDGTVANASTGNIQLIGDLE